MVLQRLIIFNTRAFSLSINRKACGRNATSVENYRNVDCNLGRRAVDFLSAKYILITLNMTKRLF